MSIIFLGDVMTGRCINLKTPIDEDILHYLHDANIRVCNLEGVITSQVPSYGQIKVSPVKYMCKHGISESQGRLIKSMKITLCNLANNHILDYGFDGVKDTIQFLNLNNIKWFGFGKDWLTAQKPRIVSTVVVHSGNSKEELGCPNIEKRKLKIAFFGVADHFVEWKATEMSAGINYFDIKNCTESSDGNPNRSFWENINHLYEVVEQVRSKCDLIVFSIHWGENFQEEVGESFQHFAHLLIDHGVDIIHGHSAHHVEKGTSQDVDVKNQLGIEFYCSRLIMYGCGEFINDYDIIETYLQKEQSTLGTEYASYDSNLSFVYKLNLHTPSATGRINFKELELLPIQIHHGRVTRCSDDNMEKLFERIQTACESFGTSTIMKDKKLFIYFEDEVF